MKKCNIIYDEFKETDIKSYIELSKTVYGDNPTVTDKNHIKWKFCDIPGSKTTIVKLMNNNSEIVGRALLQPRTIQIKDQFAKSAFITDTIVHPDFRRPMTNFINLINTAVKTKKFDLIFHTSNENTNAIYHKLLHYNCPLHLGGYGFPISISGILNKIFKKKSIIFKFINFPYKIILFALSTFPNLFSKIELSLIQPDSETVDTRCYNNAKNSDPEMLRDSKFLKWRFLNTSFWNAQIFHVYKKKTYLGYIVLRNIQLEGLSFSIIMDFSLSDKLSKLDLMFVKSSLIRKSLSNKSDFLFTMLNPNSKSSKKILGFPFIRIPEKYLPHETPIFVHVNNDKFSNIGKDDNLHITLGDLDYF